MDPQSHPAHSSIPPDATVYHLASIFRRFFATIIDSILLTTFFLFSLSEGLFGVTIGLLYLIYEIVMIGNYGQTLGKMILQIRVVTLTGQKPTYSQATIRAFTKIVSYIVFCLGYIWALLNSRKQTWHDLAARTVVVEA